MTSLIPHAELTTATSSHSRAIHIPLIARTPHPECDLVVAIPVRDESDAILETLAALARQVDFDGCPLDVATFEVILLANNCRDDTVAKARRFSLHHSQLALHIVDLTLQPDAHVGRARRLVMDEACARLLQIGKTRGIIATTDGDTRPSPTWIAATKAEVEAGADAVGGRIRINRTDLRTIGARRLRYHLRDVGYRSLIAELEARLDPDTADPWPRHFQHFGASMAVTVDAYQRVGGLPVRPSLEDVALHAELVRIDARIRHSPLVQVETSARQTGRTGFGFAVQLAQWEAMDRDQQQMQVESAAASEERILARRQLQRAWQGQLNLTELQLLAKRLCVPVDWLTDALTRDTTFGALTQDVCRQQHGNGLWRSRWPVVDIRDAISDLRVRLDGLRQISPGPALKEVEPVETVMLAQQVV